MKTFFRVSIYISVLSLSFGIHQMATSGSKILAMQDSPQVLFTFSDSTGKLLITLGSESVGHTPEFKAIESNGETTRLEYVERRESKPNNTGRLTASNFSNLGGHLFRLLDGKFDPNRTFLLCAKKFLSKRQPLKIVPSNFEPLDSSISSEIAVL